MAQAIGDPEELERFAHSLQQFVDSLNDAVGNLNHAFASLGDTWQDEKRARFEEDYNALHATKSLIHQTEDHLVENDMVQGMKSMHD